VAVLSQGHHEEVARQREFGSCQHTLAGLRRACRYNLHRGHAANLTRVFPGGKTAVDARTVEESESVLARLQAQTLDEAM